MRKSASEIIHELEQRIAQLEKSAGTMDFFKSYKSRAEGIVKEIQGILPRGVFASKPEKVNKKSRQAKAIFRGYIGLPNSAPVDTDLDRHYRIVFLSDDDYRSPFEYGLDDLYTQSSFTFYLDGRAVATAKNGIMDRDFMSKIKRSLSVGRKASFSGRLLNERSRTRKSPMPSTEGADLGFNGRSALLAYFEAVSAIEKTCKLVKALRKVDEISNYYVSKKLNALKFFKKMTQDNGDIVHNGVGASKIGFFDFVYKSGVAVVYDQLFSLGFHIKNWKFDPYSSANGSYEWDLEVTLTLGHYEKNPTVLVGHIRSQRDVVRVVSKLLDECDTLIERNYNMLVMSPKSFGKIKNMTYRNEYDS